MTKKASFVQRAAMLCNDAQFRLWLDRRRRAKFKMDIPDGTHTPVDARDFILRVCNIESRRELDSNTNAQQLFFKMFGHYKKWRDSYN